MSNEHTERLIRQAKEIGFTTDRKVNGKGHLIFIHDESGKRYVAPSTPSDWRSAKNALAAMERLSGRKIDRVSHKKSRKSGHQSGYLETVPSPAQIFKREQNRALADQRSRRVEELLAEHNEMVLWLSVITSGPCTNAEVNDVKYRLRRVLHIEDVLTEMDVNFVAYVPSPNKYTN